LATRLGQGEFAYEVIDSWGALPDGWVLGDVAAVAVDAKDQVVVFHRGEHPVIIFDRDGRFLRSWGDGVFNAPHGLDIGRDGMIYCTDAGDHTVRKFTPEGKLELTIGIPGEPAPAMSGNRSIAAPTPPFRREATSTSPTATQMRGCINTHPMGS